MILSGLGADELLGGYSRHRTAFKRGGWLALLDEACVTLGEGPVDLTAGLVAARCRSTSHQEFRKGRPHHF